MAQIRSKNTKPELLLRSALFRRGLRFRVHKKGMPGSPDIVLPKYKTVVFVHGCFWHLHPGCREGRIPTSRNEYWRPKLLANVERDKSHQESLEKSGWKVLVVWECEIEDRMNDIVEFIILQLNATC